MEPTNMTRALREGRYKSGSCVVCGRGTDTAVAFEGDAKWNAALLTVLGIPFAEAPGVISSSQGLEPPNVRTGRYSGLVRVCGECHSASGLPSDSLHLAIPGVRWDAFVQQPHEGTDR